MAKITQRRTENVFGNFYVDRTCIDCDTCRWMMPSVFDRIGEQSAVHHQPVTEAEKLQAMQALLSCPTASIGTVEKPKNIKTAQASFPILIDDNIYHCGYHSEKSYAATSYLIQRPEGNVLVDSPRFSPPLVKQLEAMGGIRYLYLTHRDDVADHQKYQAHFGCDRLLHTDDITDDTRDVEIQLTGVDPIQFAPDIFNHPRTRSHQRTYSFTL
jgi:ferredoxin